ncbi:MAG: hypothetical protein K2K77_07030 [Duncaniella sp.]|nr:hypothetical protein [Duncaniella sp.]
MKSLYKSLLTAAALLTLGACSPDDAWLPGDADATSVGAFFKGLEKYDVTVEADDPHVFDVQIDRLDATAEATVPLKVLSCPEGVVVPESIDFAAGETSATFQIDVTEMAPKTSGTVQLQIDPAYASMYGAGSSVLSLKVTMAGGWVVLADDVKISCYINTSYPVVSGELYVLEGSNRFKIPDFLGSGTDLVFTLSDTSLSYPVIFPFSNYKYYYELWPSDYEDDEDYPWYFYDTEKAAYPAIWTPAGWSKSIEYLSFYVYDGTDKGCYFSIKNGYGTMESYIEFADGSGSWEYFEFNYTSKFDPFAQD